MSIFNQNLTLEEATNQIEKDGGFRMYTSYIGGLLCQRTDDGKALSEAEFIEQCIHPQADLDPDTERMLQFIPQSLGAMFQLVEWLVQAEEASPRPPCPQVFTAVHIEFFRRQYLIADKLQIFVSSMVDQSGHDDEEGYLEELKAKFGLSNIQAQALQFPWGELDATISHGLLEDDFHVTPFLGKPICFQVYNRDKEEFIQAPNCLMTDNGLIISKYFFVSRIVTILSNLDLLAKVVASEKEQNYQEAKIDVRELFELETFTATAREILERM